MAELPDVTYSFLHRKLSASWADVGGARLTAPEFDNDAATFTGAAYRSDGSLVLESLRPSAVGHWRPVDPVSIAWFGKTSEPVVMDTAIYGGHFFTMWGHFLYETLSTAAVVEHMPDVPVVFTPFAPDASLIVTRRDWNVRRDLLAAAGWGDRELILQEDAMRFRRLIVPERLSVYAAPYGGRGMVQEVAKVYDRIRQTYASAVNPSRVIVARRPVAFVRTHPEEEALYGALSELGFTIADGANMSPDEQVKMFASAKTLIGFTGSNLHNSIFCHRDIMVLELGDARSYQSTFEKRNRNQISICELLNQEHLFLHTYDIIDGKIQPLPLATIVENIRAACG